MRSNTSSCQHVMCSTLPDFLLNFLPLNEIPQESAPINLQTHTWDQENTGCVAWASGCVTGGICQVIAKRGKPALISARSVIPPTPVLAAFDFASRQSLELGVQGQAKQVGVCRCRCSLRRPVLPFRALYTFVDANVFMYSWMNKLTYFERQSNAHQKGSLETTRHPWHAAN